MKKRAIYILFFSLIFSQCGEDSSVNPNLYIPDSTELGAMIIHQIVARDSIHILASENAFLDDTYYSHIILGHMDKFSAFTPIDTILPNYQKFDNKYLLQFMSSIRAPKSIVTYDIMAKFYTNEKNYTSTLISVELYKYPFTSSEVYLNLDAIPDYPDISDIAFIQGFEISQNDIYYHLSGGFGVYKYTLGENYSELLSNPPGGDWISLYNNHLYIDVSHYIIGRLDLQNFDYDSYFIQDENWDIRGMDFKNDTLFVLHENKLDGTNPNYLTTFDVNGNVISTEPFNYPHGGWSITIHEEDLYTWSFGDIVKYHIPSNEAEIIYPNLDISIESVQIMGDRFYYSDVDKRIICYLPLHEFLSH